MRRWWWINIHSRVHVLLHRHIRVHARLYFDGRLLLRAQTALLLYGLIARGTTARHVLPDAPSMQMVMVRSKVDHYSVHREARVEAAAGAQQCVPGLPPPI